MRYDEPQVVCIETDGVEEGLRVPTLRPSLPGRSWRRQKEKLSRFETDGVRSPSATSGKASQAAERPAVFRLLKISCRDTCWFSPTYAAFRVLHAQACAARRTMKTAEKVAMIRSGMYSARRFPRAFFGNRPARLCFRAGFPRTRVCRMPRGLVFLCVQPVSDVLKRNMHGLSLIHI